MWEAIYYEISMMTRKNFLMLSGIAVFFYGIFIYLPRDRANYRLKRVRIEANYEAETPGQLINIRRLYLPAGEEGIIRFVGYEIQYQAEIDNQVLKNKAFIPKNPDQEINRRLKEMMEGNTSVIIKYKIVDPGKNTVKLLDG